MQQIEGIITSRSEGRPARSTFCMTAKSVVPSSAGTTTSPSMNADLVFRCQASVAIFLNRSVQSWPRRVYVNALVGDVQLHAIAVELHFMYPAVARQHLANRRRERRRNESGEGRFHATFQSFRFRIGHVSSPEKLSMRVVEL
jgi:hypothetical protein